MLTYNELKALLQLNEILLHAAKQNGNFEEITRLMTHRAVIKDCIIELLSEVA